MQLSLCLHTSHGHGPSNIPNIFAKLFMEPKEGSKMSFCVFQTNFPQEKVHMDLIHIYV